MIRALNDLVESRIQEAQAAGEFDCLPGAGKPLDLDDDAMIPEELRVAYRLLKNAGFVPPEVAGLREAAGLQAALASACDQLSGTQDRESRRMQRRLAAVSAALDAHGIDLSTMAQGRYYRQTLLKLAGQSNSADVK